MPRHFVESGQRASKGNSMIFRTPTRRQRCAKSLGFVFPVVFWLATASLAGVGVWSFLERRNLVRGEEKHDDLDMYLKDDARKDLLYSENPTFLAMAAGGFGMFVGVLGFLGFLRKRSCLLVLFICGVVVFFMSSLATGFMALVYRETLEMDTTDLVKQEVKDQMNDAILSKQLEYHSETVDHTQTRFKCCGADSFRDWEESVQFNCSSDGSLSCGVPLSCCRDSESTCSGRLRERDDVETFIFTQGCVGSHELEKMVQEAVDTTDLLVLSIFGFALAPVSMVVLFLASLHLHYLETQ